MQEQSLQRQSNNLLEVVKTASMSKRKKQYLEELGSVGLASGILTGNPASMAINTAINVGAGLAGGTPKDNLGSYMRHSALGSAIIGVPMGAIMASRGMIPGAGLVTGAIGGAFGAGAFGAFNGAIARGLHSARKD